MVTAPPGRIPIFPGEISLSKSVRIPAVNSEISRVPAVTRQQPKACRTIPQQALFAQQALAELFQGDPFGLRHDEMDEQ